MSEPAEDERKFTIHQRVEALRNPEENVWYAGFIKELDEDDDESYLIIDDISEQVQVVKEQNVRLREMDEESFVLAASYGFLNVVMSWVQNGNDPRAAVHELSPNPALRGCTALAAAARRGRLEVVRYLVEDAGLGPRGALEDGGAGAGPSPLERALAAGCLEVASYFAHLDVKGVKGLAQLQSDELHYATAQAFEDRGVKGHTKLKRKRVFIMSVREFRRNGRFKSYQECVKDQILMSAIRIRPSSKILYISHTWEKPLDTNVAPVNKEGPDPMNRLYNRTIKFLDHLQTNTQEAINYVYLGYSCCPTSPEEDNVDARFHALHLRNSATALFLSTHLLLLPPLKDIAARDGEGIEDLWDITESSASLRPPSNQPLHATDLQAVFRRGWLQTETVGALITESSVWCHYRLGQHLDAFVPVEGSGHYDDADGLLRADAAAEGAHESWQTGLVHACKDAVTEYKQRETTFERILKQFVGARGWPDDYWQAWRTLRRLWLGSPDAREQAAAGCPFALLAAAVDAQAQLARDPDLLLAVRALTLTRADMEEHVEEQSLVGRLYSMMGETYNEDDKTLLTNIALLIVSFCTGKLSSYKKGGKFSPGTPGRMLRKLRERRSSKKQAKLAKSKSRESSRERSRHSQSSGEESGYY